MKDRHIDINVPVLARVEGEGALDLRIENNAITDLKLRIYEPPRYFEKFLEGRSFRDVPDTVARICGICPVAYQMSAVHAIDNIFNINATPWVRSMRRLMYCGEWIQSHSLHIHMLAAPDFLGFNSIIEMSAEYPAEVRRGLKLQALGNDIIRLLGGRSVHPVNVRSGGFYQAPAVEDVASLQQRLQESIQDSVDLVQWVSKLVLPDDEQEFESVSLRHEDEYAMNEGRLVSDKGLDIAIDEFEQHFREEHVPHSTALHCRLHDGPYLVGPLARLNNNIDKLPGDSRILLDATGVSFPSKNMFHSIIARAIEIHFALNEAIRLMQDYSLPSDSYSDAQVVSGTGYGCTEAPRGVLWHRYELDENGDIVSARIVPPTSQNQARIEDDIEAALNQFGLDNDDNALQLHAEKVIRNYDPCISCATHFLTLNIERDGDTVGLATFGSETILKTSQPLSIIAVGSPSPGDDVAWRLLKAIESCYAVSHKDKNIQFHYLDRPGTDLLAYIGQAKQAGRQTVVIDPVASDDDDLMSLEVSQLASLDTGLSTHSQGVTESLALAMQLRQELPDYLLGVPVGKTPVMPSQERFAVYLAQLKEALGIGSNAVKVD